jgi:serine/threonine protein kinase
MADKDLYGKSPDINLNAIERRKQEEQRNRNRRVDKLRERMAASKGVFPKSRAPPAPQLPPPPPPMYQLRQPLAAQRPPPTSNAPAPTSKPPPPKSKAPINQTRKNANTKRQLTQALKDIGVDAPEGISLKDLAELVVKEGTEVKQIQQMLTDMGETGIDHLNKPQLRKLLEDKVRGLQEARIAAPNRSRSPAKAPNRSRSPAVAPPPAPNRSRSPAKAPLVTQAIAAAAPNNYLCFSKPEPNVTRNKSTRHLCDKNFTKRIIDEEAEVSEIIPSKSIGEGAFGSVQSAEIYLSTKTGEKLMCIGAFKTAKKKQSELSTDTLTEIGCYARLQGKPCIAKGMFIKLMPSQEKTIMEHYLKNMLDIIKIVDPATNRLRIDIEKFAKGIAYQMLVGIKGMHEERMMHRDIKPENTLLAYDGSIIMADFGLSMNIPVGFSRPGKYFTAGTPFYFSPEMAKKEGYYTSKTDIWSIGATIFMFLTGRDLLTADPTGRPGIFRDIPGRLRSLDRFSSECRSFMQNMLVDDYKYRYSAARALEDRWFDGMDLTSARNAIMQSLGDRCVRLEKTTVNATRKRENAGAASNRNIDSYMRIEDMGMDSWPGPASREKSYKDAVISIVDQKLRFETILHAIELFDRLCAITKEVKPHYTDACILTASMLNERESMRFKVSKEMGDKQRRLVNYLRGDLFALKNGLLSSYCTIAKTTGIQGLNNHLRELGAHLGGIQFDVDQKDMYDFKRRVDEFNDILIV